MRRYYIDGYLYNEDGERVFRVIDIQEGFKTVYSSKDEVEAQTACDELNIDWNGG